MKVDVACLLNGKQKEIKLDIMETIDDSRFKDEVITFPEPVVFKGNLSINSEKTIYLAGVLDVNLIAKCARCLTDVKDHMTIDVSEKFVIDSEAVDEDTEQELNLIEDFHVNLDGIFESYIVMRLPIRYLCSDSCKGLCCKCGADLNEGPCKCNRDEDLIDPRFLKLKELLDDREV